MRVRVGDVRLFVEVFGEEWQLDRDGMRQRPVLIGLHGGPGRDGTKLRHQLAPLADAVQVVVPDQRGHGRSDAGSPDSWNLATWAADVRGLCDALGIDHPIVFGTSFGGLVAQRYAADFPDHPAGLILASACARLATIDELVERFREVGGDEAADVTRRDWDDSTPETVAEWKRVCGPLLSLRTDTDPILAAAEAARIETMDVNLHYFEHEAKTLDLRPALGRVQCPTLVMVGERDPLTPIRLAEEIVEAMPSGLGRLEVIPGAAHAVIDDNPDDTYRGVRRFIAGLR